MWKISWSETAGGIRGDVLAGSARGHAWNPEQTIPSLLPFCISLSLTCLLQLLSFAASLSGWFSLLFVLLLDPRPALPDLPVYLYRAFSSSISRFSSLSEGLLCIRIQLVHFIFKVKISFLLNRSFNIQFINVYVCFRQSNYLNPCKIVF